MKLAGIRVEHFGLTAQEAGLDVAGAHHLPCKLDLDGAVLRRALVDGERHLVDDVGRIVVVVALAERFLAFQVIEHVLDDVVVFDLVEQNLILHPASVLVHQRTRERLQALIDDRARAAVFRRHLVPPKPYLLCAGWPRIRRCPTRLEHLVRIDPQIGQARTIGRAGDGGQGLALGIDRPIERDERLPRHDIEQPLGVLYLALLVQPAHLGDVDVVGDFG